MKHWTRFAVIFYRYTLVVKLHQKSGSESGIGWVLGAGFVPEMTYNVSSGTISLYTTTRCRLIESGIRQNITIRPSLINTN